jgi:GNAT superfamily N-acetyltransferase
MNKEIKWADSDESIAKCWKVMHLLRPHLLESEFLQKVRIQQDEGFEMVFIEENEIAVAVMGFRIGHYLFRGKNLYIDDLSTLPDFRGRGYAGKLLDWAIHHAKVSGCDNVHLDSGFGPARKDAHRLYLNKGFEVASLHFSIQIEK